MLSTLTSRPVLFVVLKEADSVSQPAERVRTLWKKDSGRSDPDPVHVPEPSCLPLFTVSAHTLSYTRQLGGLQHVYR